MTVYEIADTETGLTYRTTHGKGHAETIRNRICTRTGNTVEITKVNQ